MGVPEHVLASAGQRFAGRFVDNLVFLTPLFAFLFVYLALPAGVVDRSVVGLSAPLLGIGIYVAVQWHQLTRTGQTLGKRLAGTRVVDLEGEPVGQDGGHASAEISSSSF